MTSPFATNAVLRSNIEPPRFLRSNKEGYPIDKQIPLTYQYYRGTGGIGVSIDYDGSNELVIFGDNLTGPLLVRFGPSIAKIRNLIGRQLTIHINGQTFQSVTLNTSPCFMKINGTTLTQLSHVIQGDGKSKTLSLYFSSENLWNVDYGASSGSIIALPLQPIPQVFNPKYLSPFVVNIASLVVNGIAPYTASNPAMTSGIIDRSLGSINVNNGAGTITVYPPSRNRNPIFTVPVRVTDNAGTTVTSSFTAIQDMVTYATGQDYNVSAATYIATILGVQAIFTKTSTGLTSTIVDDSLTITNLAGNQNDNLMFYQVNTSNTQIYYYDPISGGAAPTGIVTQVGLGLVGAGITQVRCMSYNHDTDELFVFGNTVTSSVYIVKFERYQRSDITPPTLTQQGICVLTNALDPTTQPILSSIYSSTSYVTGCEFVDGRGIVLLSIWDPVANRSKIVTLNSQMFKNRGTSVGLLPTTYHDQYVVGVYDNALLNGLRIGLSSIKIGDKFSIAYITSSSAVFIRDFSFFSNTLLIDGGYGSVPVSGIPTEVRGTRTLINY